MRVDHQVPDVVQQLPLGTAFLKQIRRGESVEILEWRIIGVPEKIHQHRRNHQDVVVPMLFDPEPCHQSQRTPLIGKNLSFSSHYPLLYLWTSLFVQELKNLLCVFQISISTQSAASCDIVITDEAFQLFHVKIRLLYLTMLYFVFVCHISQWLWRFSNL